MPFKHPETKATTNTTETVFREITASLTLGKQVWVDIQSIDGYPSYINTQVIKIVQDPDGEKLLVRAGGAVPLSSIVKLTIRKPQKT